MKATNSGVISRPTAERDAAFSKSRLQAARLTRSRRERALRTTCQIAIIAIILTLWQLASGTIIPVLLISKPTAILHSFMEWVTDGTLKQNAIITITSTLSGFVIGAVFALIIGYALGVSRRLSGIVEPFITALWGLPRVALIPLLMIWVGVGQPLSISIAAILSFFLLFYNTFFGIRNVDQSLIDAVRIMGGSGVDIALRVRLPSALVWIAAGIKISLPMALVGVVTAEMLGSNEGLGYLVQFTANSFDTAGTFASLFALLVLGMALERGSRLISSKALAWKSVGEAD
jgi:NitT/TauT family transport system permease protein